MGAMASKWRLNKTEEKQLRQEGDEIKSQKLAEGISEEDAEKAKNDLIAERTHELKKMKADNAAAKKAQTPQSKAKAKAKPISASVHPTPSTDSVNHDYYDRLLAALQTIQNHKVFARVEEESPLDITGKKMSGVQVGQLYFLQSLHN